MDTFEVGEVVILQNVLNHYEANGEEAVILEGLDNRPIATIFGGHAYITCYVIEWRDNMYMATPHMLRKKPPPPQSWEKIEEITGWNPTKIKVTTERSG
jgi:hypothetical protein